MDLDWDDGNIGHIVDDHGVWPEDVIEALYSRPIQVWKGFVEGELRYRGSWPNRERRHLDGRLHLSRRKDPRGNRVQVRSCRNPKVHRKEGKRMTKKSLPKFKSEAEEARWYSEHQDELDRYFAPVSDEEAEGLLAKLPSKEEAMAQAKEASRRYKARTTPTSIRLDDEDIEAAKQIAAKKGLRYQTWIKTIVHIAIEQEKKAL